MYADDVLGVKRENTKKRTEEEEKEGKVNERDIIIRKPTTEQKAKLTDKSRQMGK